MADTSNNTPSETRYIAPPKVPATTTPPDVTDPPGKGSPSGGSGSGGKSAEEKKAEAQAIANAAAAYENILMAWQIPMTPEIRAFIAKAAKEGMSTTLFMAKFRRTKVYAQAFKGILRGNGTMRMTEAQYIAGYNSARDYAGSVGRGLSRQLYASAIQNGNSPSEIKGRIEALDILKTQRDVFSEFNEYLVARGKAPKRGLTKKEMAQFVMGEGPAEWEQEWKTAYTAAQIEKAGIMAGPPKDDNDIGFKALGKLIKEAGPNFNPADLDWKRLSQLATEVIPLSKWQGVGITKKDLVSESVGAKTAARVAGQIQKVMAEHLAAQEQTANPSFSPGPKGSVLGQGRQAVQATE